MRKNNGSPEPAAERALQKAYRLLALRAHSEKELRLKLIARGFDKAVIGEVVALLMSKGYLDDADFAGQWARHLAVDKLLGNKKIAASLMEKGVSRELAEKAIHDARGELDEAEALRKRLGKMKGPDVRSMDDRLRKRLFRNLATKGFPPGLIYEIIRSQEEWRYDNGQ
jgi:regulatory protein